MCFTAVQNYYSTKMSTERKIHQNVVKMSIKVLEENTLRVINHTCCHKYAVPSLYPK